MLIKHSSLRIGPRRPLNDKQLRYALSDVLYLPAIYDDLCATLAAHGRSEWIIEETERLLDAELYRPNPKDCWRKLKLRQYTPRYIAVVQALAEWREEYAVAHNQPRNWVLKDDSLLEIAIEQPKTVADLQSLRCPPTRLRKEGRESLIETLRHALQMPEELLPKPLKTSKLPSKTALTDLLKLLLKWRAEEHQVAAKMIASSDEVEWLAAEDFADSPLLHGWRYEVFGRDALRIKRGELALAFAPDGRLDVIEIEELDDTVECL